MNVELIVDRTTFMWVVHGGGFPVNGKRIIKRSARNEDGRYEGNILWIERSHLIKTIQLSLNCLEAVSARVIPAPGK